jgi:hypothetical protein
LVEPDNKVPPLIVFAERPPLKLLEPDAVIELNEGDETTFTIGLFSVPPVVMFEPGCTRVMSLVSVVENILYKLVEPENKVPPLSVFADNPPVNTLVPDAVKLLIVSAETLIVGKLSVPPVYVFNPDWTLVDVKLDVIPVI